MSVKRLPETRGELTSEKIEAVLNHRTADRKRRRFMNGGVLTAVILSMFIRKFQIL